MNKNTLKYLAIGSLTTLSVYGVYNHFYKPNLLPPSIQKPLRRALRSHHMQKDPNETRFYYHQALQHLEVCQDKRTKVGVLVQIADFDFEHALYESSLKLYQHAYSLFLPHSLIQKPSNQREEYNEGASSIEKKENLEIKDWKLLLVLTTKISQCHQNLGQSMDQLNSLQFTLQQLSFNYKPTNIPSELFEPFMVCLQELSQIYLKTNPIHASLLLDQMNQLLKDKRGWECQRCEILNNLASLRDHEEALKLVKEGLELYNKLSEKRKKDLICQQAFIALEQNKNSILAH